MKTSKRAVELTLGICLSWSIPAAYAEDWVRVVDRPGGDPAYVDVDADSIRKGDDGLVYFAVEDDIGRSTSAVDCQNRIYYVIGNIPDWRSGGDKIVPGSDAAMEADFVCARAG